MSNINKHEVRVSSIGLRDGFRINAYSDLGSILNAVEGQENQIRDIVNSYCWQKGALVEARDQFTTDLEQITGFEYKTKQVEKKSVDGKASTTLTVPDETEKEYVIRFRKEVLADFVFKPAKTLGSSSSTETEKAIADSMQTLIQTNPPTDAATVEQFLQDVADLRLYECDAKHAERVAKEKKLPDYATLGAKNIITNSTQAKWINNFKKAGIQFADFQTDDEVANEKNLTLAIVAHQQAESKNKYK